MTNVIEARLVQLGITLPAPPAPIGTYVPYVVSGNLLFLSGQGPRTHDGQWLCGRVGERISVQEAYQHARLAGVRLLAAAQAVLGSLDRVRRVVKVLGFVQATPNFGEHPAVINGCSDLFVEVFGEAGRHARTSLGVASLPHDITVEIEAVLEIS
jgi:enamine deaminase RidA (YjgF/YER057c/UK114 family)